MFFKGKHEAARMELRFINKTGNRHFDKPSYVLTGILQARWVRMPWLKNTPMAHAAQFLLVYALVYMRGKPQLECLPFMVCTLLTSGSTNYIQTH